MKKNLQSGLFLLLMTVIVTLTVSFFSSHPVEAASTTNTSYGMKVLVLKYFPLTADGQNIDINVTGDIGDPYATIHQKTIDIDNNLITFLAKGSSYLGYKDATAQPSLTYQIVDTKEYTQAVPADPTTRRPLYNQILTANNICNYVQNMGVSEVWMWAYQGPNKADGQPYLAISESKMSGPFGDISNSFRLNDMPQCGKTYRVYTFNYGRGTAEAIHSWGHQIEAEMNAVNTPVFSGLWQGSTTYSYYPQTLGVTGRCGNIHNPPNARFEYDWNNPTPQNSDCLNWNPDGLGTLSAISCANWGCADISDTNNSQLNYIVWNLQNMPGRNNTKTYQGQAMRNWWDVHGEFDTVMASDKTLFLTPSPSPIPTSTPKPTMTPTPRPTVSPTPTPILKFVTSATALPVNPILNNSVTVTTKVTANQSVTELVDVEIYNSAGVKLFQQFWDNQALSSNVSKTYVSTWTPTAIGPYIVNIGIFSPGWGSLLNWNSSVAGGAVKK